MSSPMMMDNYSLRMNMNRYLNTGNPVFDWVLTGFATTLLMGLAGYLKKENLMNFLRAIKKFFSPEKPKPKIKENQVTISAKAVVIVDRDGYRDTKTDYLDDLRGQNSHMIKAIYWHLNKQRELIEKVDFGLNFNQCLDYFDEQVRDYSFLIRPTEELTLPNGIKVKCTLTKQNNPNSSSGNKSKSRSSDPRDSPEDGNDDSNNNGSNNQKSNESLEETITLTTTKPTSFIIDFLNHIWESFIDSEIPEVQREKENQKWYFVRGADERYEKYPLTSKITFDDVFFPEKEKFLKQVDQFLEGNTKFSSFKILAEGKPGGGKTSTIKALHNYTGFHIIVVRLSQIKSQEELMNLFYSPIIKKKSGGIARIPINKRIYLLEDIDADSKIVHKREDEKEDDSDSEDDDLPNKSSNQSNQQSTSISQQPNQQQIKPPGQQIQPPGQQIHQPGQPNHLSTTEKHHWDHWLLSKFNKKTSLASKNGITLASILNLFDGVLELDGCFVVMTTNHPEKLDPALIRDGRISFKIKLKEITQPHMKAMINNFHPEEFPNPEEPHPELDPILNQLPKMMPCAFEKLVEHEESLASVINNLKNKIQPPTNLPPSEAAEAL